MKGSIRKRGSTWTCYWFTKDPASGKRLQDTKGGFPTKKEAQDYLNEVLVKVAKGAWKADGKLTVKQFVDETWLPSLKNAVAAGKIKPATESFYSHLANRHILPRLGAVKLSELSAVGLNAFYAELLSTGRLDGESGLSKSTVARVHVTIHRMLRDAVSGENFSETSLPMLTLRGHHLLRWTPGHPPTPGNSSKPRRLSAISETRVL